MKAPAHLCASEKFFFEWAGWGYNPATETPQKGREDGAYKLAAAEGHASQQGWSFEWSVDPDVDSSSFSKKRPRWALWQCLCRNENGEPLSSLGGVDFGPDKEPWGDPYRRVVQAELALEGMSREMPAGISEKGDGDGE